MSITIRSAQTIQSGVKLQGSLSLLTNPQLYLDAADITASSWPDRSTHGNNATPLYVPNITYNTTPSYAIFNGTAYTALTCGPDNGNSLNITNNLTLATWLQYTDSGLNNGFGGIVCYGVSGFPGSGEGEQYSLNRQAGRKFQFSTNWPDNWYQIDSQSSLALNTWYHVAVTFSNGVLSMYLNGVLDYTTTIGISNLPTVTNAVLDIGVNQPGASEYFYGNISTVKIYNYAATSDQINTEFQLTKSRYGL